MKYFICEKIENTIKIKKEITKEQYKKYKDNMMNLQYYSLAKLFKDIAIKNGIEFYKYILNVPNMSIDLLEEGKMIGIEANRLALNYLVSFRTLVDNLQSYSKKIKDGKKFEKNVLNKLYDTEDIYAFFTKLRNYVTHYGILFDSISTETGNLELECTKEHLLEYKDWNKKNIEFLNSCPEKLPIKEFIEKMNILIMSAYLGFIQYLGKELQDIHDSVIQIMKDYEVVNPQFIECKNIKDLENGYILGIGLEELREATEEFAQLPNVKVKYVHLEEIVDKK